MKLVGTVELPTIPLSSQTCIYYIPCDFYKPLKMSKIGFVNYICVFFKIWSRIYIASHLQLLAILKECPKIE